VHVHSDPQQVRRRLSPPHQAKIFREVTARLAFVFMPTNLVFAHTVNIFAFADDATFAVLQPRAHGVWARAFASTLEDRHAAAPPSCAASGSA
jgi:hypothetical protein